MLICRNFILYVFLKICQRYCKLVILGTLDMTDYALLKRYYQIGEKFCLSDRREINFVFHVFLEILQRYANFLFWVLWVCMVTQTQNDSINLQKTLTSICIPKKKFSLFTSSLGYYILKNPAIWLANNILILDNHNFCQT